MRTAVHADDAVLYEGCQGQPIEEAVQALPGPQPLLFSHALYALQPEPKKRIDVRSLSAHTTLEGWLRFKHGPEKHVTRPSLSAEFHCHSISWPAKTASKIHTS